MPCKKKKQPLPKPKCTISSRRLIETVPIQELRHPAVVIVPSSKQVNDPSPSEYGSCGCDEAVGASGMCCRDPQCEENSRPLPEQELKTPTCLPECQVSEVEAMIDEIRNCREIIRSLAQEAMDILHPENSQQYRQVQAQQGPVANGMTCSQHDDDSEPKFIEPASQAKPIDQRQKIDCSKKKCEISEPTKYPGSKGQSTTRLFPLPPTLSKSPALSRKSSGSIAQTIHHIKEKRLGQNLVRKKPSNCSCDGEKKQNVNCSCDETMNKKALRLKPSECSCDGEKIKKADCKCDEKAKNITDCKTIILNTFGKKPSECSCGGEKKKNADCKCDDTIKKRNKENEKRENKTDSKSFLQKTFGWISCDTAPPPVVVDDCVCDDEEMEKQNKANSLKEKRKAAAASVAAAACAMPKCAANTCTCHFPPEYSQYFDCTGHVSGNCHCDKNA